MDLLWNDGWKFKEFPVDTVYEDAVKKIDEFESVEIPHDYLIYDVKRLYRDSSGYYYKKFTLDSEDKKVFVSFDGVYMDSKVYLNGRCIFEWKYGYSSFTVDLTDFLIRGENLLVVSVCHKSPNSRWYSGAGIYRDVTLHVYEKTYIPVNGVYVVPRVLNNSFSTDRENDFLLRISTDVKGKDKDYSVSYFLNGEKLHAISCDDVRVKNTFPVEDDCCEKLENAEYFLVEKPKLWDVRSPFLYSLEVRLSVGEDVIQKRNLKIGFKHAVCTTDKGFFLNGRHIKLNGVCEHHDLGALGSAYHTDAMRRKMIMLKKMGANAIRLTHNMAAENVLELADEMGFMLVSEAFDMWESPKTEYDYARFFQKWHKKDVESWIKRDRNHVSVILWSIGNEIYDTHASTRGVEITKDLVSLVHKYDPLQNAKATIGSNYMPWENAQKCADVLKIAGYNYSEKYYEEHHRQHPDWCIYGSETSSIVQSRGVYHFPLSAGILSEVDYQCSSLGNSITSWGARSYEACACVDRDIPYSMGQFLWTGFDYIGEPTPYHTKNSYFGQIDTAGFPKDAYYVWQSAWTSSDEHPMVHIFPYWDFNENQMIDVRVCSNLAFVELFCNGESFGRQKLSHAVNSGNHLIADYRIPYKKGVLRAVCYDENGVEKAFCEKKSFSDTKSFRVTKEDLPIELKENGLLFYDIEAIDEDGNVVENACDKVKVSVENGILVGLDNGDSTDEDEYKGNIRKLFYGKLLAIVKVTDVKADVKVNVASYGKVPARKVELKALGGCLFTADKKVLKAEAMIHPLNGEYKDIVFEAVTKKGVKSNLVDINVSGNECIMTARGDGEFILRCLLRDSDDKVYSISMLEYTVEGVGKGCVNPYEFVYGIEYSSSIGEVANGNEKGFATARDGETVVSFENIDFGKIGSDEITIPIFALNDERQQIDIFEGIPGCEESKLLGTFYYEKKPIWNVYQDAVWKLPYSLTGIKTLSFKLYNKLHIKGFSFKKPEKMWMRLTPNLADEIYGDSYEMTNEGAIGIGNNVSFAYKDMYNTENGEISIKILGRCDIHNTIHLRFSRENGEDEIKHVLEFDKTSGWEERVFKLPADDYSRFDMVTLLFLPGSLFDLKEFRFFKK